MYDPPHHTFNAEVFGKVRRQILQHVGDPRRIGAKTEIAGRVDQRPADQNFPDTIHHHAGGQWIGGIGDAFGQLRPAAAVAKRGIVG